jgi:hypothetical protein
MVEEGDESSGYWHQHLSVHSLRSTSSTEAVYIGAFVNQVKLHANWSLNSNTLKDYCYHPSEQYQ